jgi:predicted dinucleotide-binding enzyme
LSALILQGNYHNHKNVEQAITFANPLIWMDWRNKVVLSLPHYTGCAPFNNKQSNKMKIGIIGAGQIGGTLIRQYSKAGHSVKMTNYSGIEKLKSLALETGASAVSLASVVTDVDVIVISIPLIGTLKLPQGLFKNTPANITIIDTSNYYPIRDGIIEDIENGMPESVWVSDQLQRPVIKAYNSILYRSLVNSGLPGADAFRLALPVSGDDKQSKDLVSILVDDSGFDSFDYGSLLDSWKQQPGSPVYCTDLTLPQLKKSIEKARKELLPGRRELGLKYILSHDPELWMDCVKYNRIIYESDLDV